MRAALVWLALAACHDAPTTAEATGSAAQPRRAEINTNARPHVHPAPAAPAGDRAFYRSTFSTTPDVAATMELGAQLFRDPSLSGSGKLACATCHDPSNAFAPATALAFQRGGMTGTAIGVRASPSLRYLQGVPAFS